jgi:uncharacterized protein (UPF0333 family)
MPWQIMVALLVVLPVVLLPVMVTWYVRANVRSSDTKQAIQTSTQRQPDKAPHA